MTTQKCPVCGKKHKTRSAARWTCNPVINRIKTVAKFLGDKELEIVTDEKGGWLRRRPTEKIRAGELLLRLCGVDAFDAYVAALPVRVEKQSEATND